MKINKVLNIQLLSTICVSIFNATKQCKGEFKEVDTYGLEQLFNCTKTEAILMAIHYAQKTFGFYPEGEYNTLSFLKSHLNISGEEYWSLCAYFEWMSIKGLGTFFRNLVGPFEADYSISELCLKCITENSTEKYHQLFIENNYGKFLCSWYYVAVRDKYKIPFQLDCNVAMEEIPHLFYIFQKLAQEYKTEIPEITAANLGILRQKMLYFLEEYLIQIEGYEKDNSKSKGLQYLVGLGDDETN